MVVVGGIYSPNHQTNRWGCAAVDGRTGQSGVPPDTVRCGSHITQPLGFWRFRSLELWRPGAPDSLVPHRTGTIQCLVRLLSLLWLCAHCAIVSRPLESTVALVSRCSADTPDSPVNYSGARTQKPEGEEFEVDPPWHTGHCPVRQTRVLFGFFCSFLLNPNSDLFIGLCWTFGTCRTYNLEQTS
jgi:hypothetical protein